MPGIEDSDLKVKDWFLRKINTPDYAMDASLSELRYGGIRVLENRPKAIKAGFTVETLDGEHDIHLSRWIPKSALESRRKYEVEAEARYRNYQNKYSAAIEFAKKNNIKGVRRGLKKATILRKIKENGLDYEW